MIIPHGKLNIVLEPNYIEIYDVDDPMRHNDFGQYCLVSVLNAILNDVKLGINDSVYESMTLHNTYAMPKSNDIYYSRIDYVSGFNIHADLKRILGELK